MAFGGFLALAFRILCPVCFPNRDLIAFLFRSLLQTPCGLPTTGFTRATRPRRKPRRDDGHGHKVDDSGSATPIRPHFEPRQTLGLQLSSGYIRILVLSSSPLAPRPRHICLDVVARNQPTCVRRTSPVLLRHTHTALGEPLRGMGFPPWRLVLSFFDAASAGAFSRKNRLAGAETIRPQTECLQPAWRHSQDRGTDVTCSLLVCSPACTLAAARAAAAPGYTKHAPNTSPLQIEPAKSHGH